MKKRPILTGLAVFVLGALLFGAGWLGSGGDLGRVNGSLGPIGVHLGGGGGAYTAEEYRISPAGITSVELDETNADVVVTQSATGEIRLRYQESADDTMEIGDHDGRLTMKRRGRIGFFLFWSPEPVQRTELLLPQGLNAALIVSSDNGSVTAQKLAISGDAAFSSDNGDVEVRTLYADDVTLKASNGAVTAQDVRCGDMTVTNNNGKIEAETVECAALRAATDNGRVSLTDIAAGIALYAESDNGAIGVDNISAGTSIELVNSNGSIRGTLAGSSDDYSIESKTSNGSNNLPGGWGKGGVRLTVRTGNGDIDIHFAKD